MDHDPLRIEELLDAEPVARRARAHRVVEREQLRFEFGKTVAADRAGHAVREYELLAARLIHPRDACHAVSHVERGLERFSQALRQVFADLEAVDHYLDAVLASRIELRRIVQLCDFAVDARAYEA